MIKCCIVEYFEIDENQQMIAKQKLKTINANGRKKCCCFESANSILLILGVHVCVCVCETK